MKKKIVAFDVDGVLAKFEQKLVDVLVGEFGKMGGINRFFFSLEDRFKNHPDVLKKALQYVADPNFYYSIPRDDGACDFVADLMEDGWGVMYVTSRPRSHETFTRRWLQKNTNKYEKSYGLFCGISNKSEFLKDVDVEFLVEDNPEEIIRCKNSKIPVMCWAQQWNDHLFPRLYTDKEGVLMLWIDEESDATPFWSLVKEYDA